MKGVFRDILIALAMGVVVPSVVLSFGVALEELREEKTVSRLEQASGEQADQAILPEFSPAEENSGLEMLFRGADGEVTAMDMDEYLLGAVLAEMPADFEVEALKAQAVAARTYARRAYVTGGKHGDGSVCGNYACCQAYISPEDYLEKGGTPEGVDKVRSCVEATSGVVLTYEGVLIEATYFSCSGGRTEDAVAVWGTEFPYLQAVDSPGEEGAAHYRDTVIFLPEVFCARLGLALTGEPESWFGETVCTDGGGVDTLVIGETVFRGTELRALLGLRSTAFTVDASDGNIHITTRGYGHRVGMSQYGADAMAVTGAGYGEILAHYYPGTVLERIQE